MSVNEKDISEFEDMFDLSSDKKDDENEQTEEYGHSTESSDSFEDLAKEVAEDIEKSDDKGSSISDAQEFDPALTDDEVKEIHKEDPHDIVKDVCSGGICPIPVPEVEAEVSKVDDFLDELDGIAVTIEEVVKVEDKPEETNFDEIAAPTVNVDVIPTYGEVGSGRDKIKWTLTSPSDMFNSFYAKKRDLLFEHMVGGEIEYTRWTHELEEAQVIIQGEIFDHQLIIDQMEAVQQHRERVKAIHVKVNNQYFTFKRFVELMRGFLARIEYLKPVLKQEGLIMEHMRDIELYYARLEALHDSATKTEKTLASAFDTLSRKCTICMELKPAERVELRDSENSSYVRPAQPAPAPTAPVVREHSSEFDDFDDLPSNAQAAPITHKVGAIGWGDI